MLSYEDQQVFFVVLVDFSMHSHLVCTAHFAHPYRWGRAELGLDSSRRGASLVSFENLVCLLTIEAWLKNEGMKLTG